MYVCDVCVCVCSLLVCGCECMCMGVHDTDLCVSLGQSYDLNKDGFISRKEFQEVSTHQP